MKAGGTIDYQGLRVTIETPAGTKRHWTDQQGRKGSTLMRYPYGYVEGTEGQDGDEVDVFVGPDPRAPEVFVVHQQNPETKQYDETKCFLGFHDKETVEKVYRQHYDRSDFQLWTDTMAVDAFKRWLGGLQTPARRERFVMQKSGPESASPGLAPVVVQGSGQMTERAMSAWRGSGANYLVGSPPRGVPKSDPKELTPDMREIMRIDEERHLPDSLRRDLRIYDFNDPLDVQVRRFDFPEEWKEQFKQLAKEAPRNKEHTNRERNRIKPVVRNTVDPRDSQPLEKAMAPVRKKIVRTPVRGQGVVR